MVWDAAEVEYLAQGRGLCETLKGLLSGKAGDLSSARSRISFAWMPMAAGAHLTTTNASSSSSALPVAKLKITQSGSMQD
jgi:hypothetical protein